MVATGRRDSLVRLWSVTLAACACAPVVLDLVLLDRKMNYVRGGFLAWQHLAGAGDIAAFVVCAVLGNAAVMGLPMWVGFVAARRVGLRRVAAIVVVAGSVVGAITAATLVSYEILRYVGDLANVRVLLGLAGDRLSELLAVSTGHLLKPSSLLLVSLVALAILTWNLHRHGNETLPDDTGGLRAVATVVAGCVAAAGVSVSARVASETLDFGLSRTVTGTVLGVITQRVSDVDGDGFGLLQRPADTAMWDRSVHPYALDVPVSGIDEDGIAGDLPSAEPRYVEPALPSGNWQIRPTVLLVLLESVRADAVGSHVDGRAVTPYLDALAAQGLFTRDAWAHNGFTSPARHHLYAGSLAGLRGTTTLIDDFKAQGYDIAYLSGQDETFGGPELNVGTSRADYFFHALDAPAERYTRFTTPGSLALPFGVVERKVNEYLDRRRDSRPLFLSLNFHDTHFPYHHDGVRPVVADDVVPQSSIAPEEAVRLRRMYLNTLANVDQAIGRIVERLRASSPNGLGVIVTSDHGESLFDDGVLGHGFTLGGVQTQVPLVISGLGLEVPTPVGHSEIRDALFDALLSGRTIPRLVERTAAPLMQYVGSLQEPAEIGWVAPSGSIVYDFRGNRVRAGAGRWQAAASLDSVTTTRTMQLITAWERLRLAQVASTSPAGTH